MLIEILPLADRSAVGELHFLDKQSSPHYTGFKAPDSVSANIVWVTPGADGQANQPMTTNGSGTLQFGDAIRINTYVQFFDTPSASGFSWQIGATTLSTLSFQNSSSVERMRIADFGTGCSLIAPAAVFTPAIGGSEVPLTVNGYPIGQTADLFQVWTYFSGQQLLALTPAGVLEFSDTAGFRYSGGNLQWSDDLSTWYNFSFGGYWTLSGTSLYPNSTSYNVAIGTATPGSRFTVATSASLIADFNGGVGGYIRVSDGTNVAFVQSYNGAVLFGSLNNVPVRIVRNAGATTALYIDTSDRVLVNASVDDGSGASLQSAAGASITGTVQSVRTGTAIAFQTNDGSGHNFFQVDGQGDLSMTGVLKVNQQGGSITAVGSTVAYFAGANTTATGVLIDSYSQTSFLYLRRSDGTQASPSAVQTADALGAIAWQGYGASAYASTNTALIAAYAAENWTNTAQGSYLSVLTTPTGTATANEVIRFSASRQVQVGATIGSSAAVEVAGWGSNPFLAYFKATNSGGPLVAIENSATYQAARISGYVGITGDIRCAVDDTYNLGVSLTTQRWHQIYSRYFSFGGTGSINVLDIATATFDPTSGAIALTGYTTGSANGKTHVIGLTTDVIQATAAGTYLAFSANDGVGQITVEVTSSVPRLTFDSTAGFRWNGSNLQWSNDLSTWNTFASTAAYWTLSGASLYPSSTSDNVVIGGTTPNTKFTVVSASNQVADFNGGAGSYITVYNGTDTAFMQAYGGVVLFGSLDNVPVKIVRNGGGTVAVYINTSDQVGINTVTPQNTLSVAGGSAIPTYRAVAASNAAYYWDFGRENATTGDWILMNANGGVSTEKLRVTVAGILCVGAIADDGSGLLVQSKTGFSASNVGTAYTFRDVAGAFLVNGQGDISIKGGFTLNQSSGSISTVGGAVAYLAGGTTAATALLIDAYANSPFLYFRRADTSQTAPSAVQANEPMGVIAWQGYGTSYAGNNRALIAGYAAENWTGSAQGTYLSFQTTISGGTSTVEVCRVNASRQLQVGGGLGSGSSFESAPWSANGIAVYVGGNGNSSVAPFQVSNTYTAGTSPAMGIYGYMSITGDVRPGADATFDLGQAPGLGLIRWRKVYSKLAAFGGPTETLSMTFDSTNPSGLDLSDSTGTYTNLLGYANISIAVPTSATPFVQVATTGGSGVSCGMWVSGNVPQFYCGGNAGQTFASTGIATLAATGGIVTAHTATSDERLKENFAEWAYGLDALRNLRGKSWNWNAEAARRLGVGRDLMNRREMSFIAQDVLAAMPDAVFMEWDGYYGYHREAVTMTLVNATNEIDGELLQAKQKIAQLEAKVEGLERRLAA